MVCKRLTALALATVIGAAPGAPAQARFVGSGIRGGGGLAVAHAGGVSGFHGEFVPGHRPFFPYRRFVPPFVGISAFYAYGPSYPSCWTQLPTDFGWRRVWVCNWPYGLGYDYY